MLGRLWWRTTPVYERLAPWRAQLGFSGVSLFGSVATTWGNWRPPPAVLTDEALTVATRLGAAGLPGRAPAASPPDPASDG